MSHTKVICLYLVSLSQFYLAFLPAAMTSVLLACKYKLLLFSIYGDKNELRCAGAIKHFSIPAFSTLFHNSLLAHSVRSQAVERVMANERKARKTRLECILIVNASRTPTFYRF